MRTNEPDPRLTVPTELTELTLLANRAARKMLKSRENCIFVSYALNALVQDLGYSSRVARITSSACPTNAKLSGVILGSGGDGTRRPPAERDMWHGHLGVFVEERWLLDPTLDQASRKWMRVPPIAVELKVSHDRFHAFLELNGCYLNFSIYRKQVGFKHAADARPSHWGMLYVAVSQSKAFKKIATDQSFQNGGGI